MLLADIIGTIADEFEEVTQSYFAERPIKHKGFWSSERIKDFAVV